MSLNLAEKQAVVAEVAAVAASAKAMVTAEYRGLSVARLTQLRVRAREKNVYVRVVKNTLARRAVQGTAFECIAETLVGPLLLAFSQQEPGSAARVIKDFLKEKDNDKLVVKGLVFDGKLLAAKDLDMIASMPTRDEAISLLMATMKAPFDKLARTLDAVRIQKEAA